MKILLAQCVQVAFATVTLLTGQGCDKVRGPEDALDRDPWYMPGHPNYIVPDRVGRAEAARRLPFKLAIGQGKELKVEVEQIEVDRLVWSSRVTYELNSGNRYRICQGENISDGGPGSKYDPKVQYEGTEIWYSQTGPYAWAEFDHKLLGEVEMASQDLTSTELLTIAKTVVDNAAKNGRTAK